MVSVSVWGATSSSTYNFRRALLPWLSPEQLCGALQRQAHPTWVPGKAGDIPVHPSTWAGGGEGWAALGVWVGGGGHVLFLGLPS